MPSNVPSISSLQLLPPSTSFPPLPPPSSLLPVSASQTQSLALPTSNSCWLSSTSGPCLPPLLPPLSTSVSDAGCHPVPLPPARPPTPTFQSPAHLGSQSSSSLSGGLGLVLSSSAATANPYGLSERVCSSSGYSPTNASHSSIGGGRYSSFYFHPPSLPNESLVPRKRPFYGLKLNDDCVQPGPAPLQLGRSVKPNLVNSPSWNSAITSMPNQLNLFYPFQQHRVVQAQPCAPIQHQCASWHSQSPMPPPNSNSGTGMPISNENIDTFREDVCILFLITYSFLS